MTSDNQEPVAGPSGVKRTAKLRDPSSSESSSSGGESTSDEDYEDESENEEEEESGEKAFRRFDPNHPSHQILNELSLEFIKMYRKMENRTPTKMEVTTIFCKKDYDTTKTIKKRWVFAIFQLNYCTCLIYQFTFSINPLQATRSNPLDSL